MRTGIFERGSRALETWGCSTRAAKLSRYLCGALIIGCGFVSLAPFVACGSQYVELDYNLGAGSRVRSTVFLELFDDKPLTTANFLQYVNASNTTPGVLSNYSGSIMHRLARNFVLQGGGYWPSFVSGAPWATLNPSAVVDIDGNVGTANPTVPSEYNSAPIRSNLTGTVSMALSTGPNSGQNQWFINLANNSFLDSASSGGPFTVFGQVAGDGMNLINAYNNGLSIGDFNPDYNNNGVQDDSGPFFGSLSQPLDSTGQPTDGVPYKLSGTSEILLVLNKAKQIDYLGNGLQTTVPAAGLTFSARDAFIDLGSSFTGPGALTIGPGRTLGIREGISLGHDLGNHGILAPGLQLGSITVQNYAQFADGRLDIQIASASPATGYADTQYDRVIATGQALLAGQLNVTFFGSYAPAANDTFTVLTASSIIGAFTTFNLPMLPLGDVWNISKTSTAYNLTVVYADFNHDGVVNTADYIVWRDMRNMTVTKWSGADANGDGSINDLDYAIWRANFGGVRGTSSGAGSGSGLSPGGVPEPGAGFLVAMGIGIAAVKRRLRST